MPWPPSRRLGALPLAALLALAAPGCAGGGNQTAGSDSASTVTTDDETTTSDGSSSSTTTTTTSTVTGATDVSSTTDDSTTGEPETPGLSCPGDPSGLCDPAPGAKLRAGASVGSIVPYCWESWIDKNGDAKFEATKDTLLDCGCDRKCPGDPGYVQPDMGEGDKEFQAIYLAGFGQGRAAAGIRGPEIGLRGEGDGWYVRAIVLEQGNTSLAIVTIDTIGYFNDDIEAIRKMLADSGYDIDHLIVQAIHNHEGPDTMGLWGKEFLVSGYDDAYGSQVRQAIVDAIGGARKDMRDVKHMVVGEVDISTYSDKGVANVISDHRDPWVVDEFLSAARLVDDKDETIATMISYGCHPETAADENLLMTADFVHALRATVESGSIWKTAPGKEGFGGPAIYINAAVGGMMTTLGVHVTNPDGDEYSSASIEKADSIGQLLGEMAIDAVENGEVVEAPELSFANIAFYPEVINTSFQLLFQAQVLKRMVYPAERGEGMTVRTEMSLVNLGPIQMLSVPGELLPEIAVGGYDGSRINAPGVDLIDPNNVNPPKVDTAPKGPYLKDRMTGTYRWIIGLGNDELGYIVPNYDFVLAQDMPWVNEAEGDHYEETNSLGPHMEGLVNHYGDVLIQWSQANLGH
ncbi:MAG: hypothetical protein R3B09_15110 [Nannocystaceae bacterium]